MKNEHAVKNAAVEEKPEVKLDLSFEELEAKVAPGVKLNHNEILVVEIEELEGKVAPGRTLNHNQTMLRDLM